MDTDAIAAIRPALQELAESRRAPPSAEGDLCVTFSIPGRNDDCWVQVLAGTLNFAFPRRSSPEEALRSALGNESGRFELLDWEPGRFATFSFDELADVTGLASVIERIFANVQNASVGAGIDVELSRV